MQQQTIKRRWQHKSTTLRTGYIFVKDWDRCLPPTPLFSASSSSVLSEPYINLGDTASNRIKAFGLNAERYSANAVDELAQKEDKKVWGFLEVDQCFVILRPWGRVCAI